MVTGTAVLMAACATVGAPPKEYTQEMLDPRVQVQNQIPFDGIRSQWIGQWIGQ